MTFICYESFEGDWVLGKDEVFVEVFEKTEWIDDVLLLDSGSDDGSESDGSGWGSGLDTDFLGEVGRPDWNVCGLSVNVDIYAMVSGNDDTDDVSLVSLFFFFVLDILAGLVTFVLGCVRTMWQGYMFCHLRI